jgi:hypothetical protein
MSRDSSSDVDAETFQHSDLLRSAVVHKLSVIGEAAARLSNDEPSAVVGTDRRLPQYPHRRVFWNRLGLSVASCNGQVPDSSGASREDSGYRTAVSTIRIACADPSSPHATCRAHR